MASRVTHTAMMNYYQCCQHSTTTLKKRLSLPTKPKKRSPRGSQRHAFGRQSRVSLMRDWMFKEAVGFVAATQFQFPYKARGPSRENIERANRHSSVELITGARLSRGIRRGREVVLSLGFIFVLKLAGFRGARLVEA